MSSFYRPQLLKANWKAIWNWYKKKRKGQKLIKIDLVVCSFILAHSSSLKTVLTKVLERTFTREGTSVSTGRLFPETVALLGIQHVGLTLDNIFVVKQDGHLVSVWTSCIFVK